MKTHFLSDEIYPTLTDDERAECDKEITVTELTHALSLLNKDSAPGSDGLPPSFYTHFWEKLQIPFFKCILQSIEKGELPFTLKNGIITLIHKGKNLDRNDLSNYRPITLTNTDYKIFTKALALRLQKVIKTVVNEDQIEFVKGRNIASHLRLFDDLAKYLSKKQQQKNRSGALVALDFSKAFDALSKRCIKEALDILNFGSHFQKLIQTAMEATQSCVQNGGWLSSWFPTERGIRQGCPLSPLLFIIAVEILAIRIRNNPDVRGIQVNEDRNENLQTNTTKIKQFADDTTLTKNDEKDTKLAISIVEQFQEFSGLRLNKRKSEGIWMGSRKHERVRIHDIPMKGMIQILGIFYSAEKEASTLENNWTSKIENLIRTIKQWENRNPTPYGKVIIAKTLLLSQFPHVLQILALPQSVLTCINTIIYRFLWKRKYNNKRAFEKIKRNVLSLDIEEGGLKMINIEKRKKKNVPGEMDSKFIFTPILSIHCALNATVDPKHNQAINQIESHFWREATKATTLMNKNREPDLDSIR